MLDTPLHQHQSAIGITATRRTTDAGMPPLRQVFFAPSAALVTGLRGFEPLGGRFSVHRTSFCRFVSEHREKRCGRTIQNSAVEPGLLARSIGEELSGLLILSGLGTPDEGSNMQLFRGNDGGFAYQSRRQFVLEIQPLPGGLARRLRLGNGRRRYSDIARGVAPLSSDARRAEPPPGAVPPRTSRAAPLPRPAGRARAPSRRRSRARRRSRRPECS